MILLSELSRRRIRSINKLIRVGRTEIVVVLRVDKEKGEWRATQRAGCCCRRRHAATPATPATLQQVAALRSSAPSSLLRLLAPRGVRMLICVRVMRLLRFVRLH